MLARPRSIRHPDPGSSRKIGTAVGSKRNNSQRHGLGGRANTCHHGNESLQLLWTKARRDPCFGLVGCHPPGAWTATSKRTQDRRGIGLTAGPRGATPQVLSPMLSADWSFRCQPFIDGGPPSHWVGWPVSCLAARVATRGGGVAESTVAESCGLIFRHS
jgi:hypothetical protein